MGECRQQVGGATDLMVQSQPTTVHGQRGKMMCAIWRNDVSSNDFSFLVEANPALVSSQNNLSHFIIQCEYKCRDMCGGESVSVVGSYTNTRGKCMRACVVLHNVETIVGVVRSIEKCSAT